MLAQLRAKSSASRTLRRSLSQYLKQLYVHPLSEGGFKFSVSENPKVLALGYSQWPKADHPDDFRSEPRFVEALQKLISEKVTEDFSFIIEAGTNALTFMPIYDFREIPSYCRVPNIESVFGYIQVDDVGKMIPATYQSNVMYRMCNWNGLPKFSDFMYEQIKQELELKATSSK